MVKQNTNQCRLPQFCLLTYCNRLDT